jgi:hypothetical protein
MCSIRNEASFEWRANLRMRFIKRKSLQTGQKSAWGKFTVSPDRYRQTRLCPTMSAADWRPLHMLFGSYMLRDEDKSANFLGGIKGARKVPSHYFQFLRRPGRTAKLLYFHSSCGFDPHCLWQLSLCFQSITKFMKGTKPLRTQSRGIQMSGKRHPEVIHTSSIPALATGAIIASYKPTSHY